MPNGAMRDRDVGWVLSAAPDHPSHFFAPSPLVQAVWPEWPNITQGGQVEAWDNMNSSTASMERYMDYL